METAPALKAADGSVAGLLADLRFGKRERAGLWHLLVRF